VSAQVNSLGQSVEQYSRFSGAVGAGLAIFSRFPIVAASLQTYSLNGSPLDLKGADWASGKAVASVTVTHPVLGQLQIFNTHVRSYFFALP
jgi:sphingomyelin phosphodiesterase 2